VWVDEAGFLSVRQMLELQGLALHHSCRLILTGDTKQHHSVQWDDALRILERGSVLERRVACVVDEERHIGIYWCSQSQPSCG
jgi:hypothetical protein